MQIREPRQRCYCCSHYGKEDDAPPRHLRNMCTNAQPGRRMHSGHRLAQAQVYVMPYGMMAGNVACPACWTSAAPANTSTATSQPGKPSAGHSENNGLVRQ